MAFWKEIYYSVVNLMSIFHILYKFVPIHKKHLKFVWPFWNRVTWVRQLYNLTNSFEYSMYLFVFFVSTNTSVRSPVNPLFCWQTAQMPSPPDKRNKQGRSAMYPHRIQQRVQAAPPPDERELQALCRGPQRGAVWGQNHSKVRLYDLQQ